MLAGAAETRIALILDDKSHAIGVTNPASKVRTTRNTRDLDTEIGSKRGEIIQVSYLDIKSSWTSCPLTSSRVHHPRIFSWS